jgi:hypothetical protein
MDLEKDSEEPYFPGWELLDAAMDEAVRRALILHKALGHPIWILRDGEVVEIPPEEIEVSSEPVAGAPPSNSDR